MTIGERIRLNRKARGLTQKKLGELCGYGPQSAENVVQLWEYDKQSPPIERLRALAEALQVTIDDLIP